MHQSTRNIASGAGWVMDWDDDAHEVGLTLNPRCGEHATLYIVPLSTVNLDQFKPWEGRIVVGGASAVGYSSSGMDLPKWVPDDFPDRVEEGRYEVMVAWAT